METVRSSANSERRSSSPVHPTVKRFGCKGSNQICLKVSDLSKKYFRYSDEQSRAKIRVKAKNPLWIHLKEGGPNGLEKKDLSVGNTDVLASLTAFTFRVHLRKLLRAPVGW